jgi:UDP-glucose 4-epimerase
MSIKKNKKGKVIVTGGAGFIGSHLCSELVKQGFEVHVIDNLSTGRIQNLKHIKNKIKFYKFDLSKNGRWKKIFTKNTLYVFHLAAIADIVPSIENPDKYFNSNVLSTLNILECCRNLNLKKLIYTASSSCYGIPKKYPTKETDKVDPQYPYALSKYVAEELIIHWSKIYKIKFNSLRLFNVYGTRSRTSGTYGAMFGVFLAQKLKNKPLTIVGNGKQSRDFIYVSDVVNALIMSAKSKLFNNIFNVGNGNPIKILDIAKLLNSSFIFIEDRPGEPKKTHANIGKIKNMINWKPKISIQQGVKKLLEDINYWKDAPLWTPKNIKIATKSWFKYLDR